MCEMGGGALRLLQTQPVSSAKQRVHRLTEYHELIAELNNYSFIIILIDITLRLPISLINENLALMCISFHYSPMCIIKAT